MSLALIENEIRLLLATKEPTVVCISGRWGVGKTYAWNHYLKEAHDRSKGIGLKRYAYVSLFGVNSLDEFKYALFANAVSVDAIGKEPGIETLKANMTATSEQWGKQALPILSKISFFKKYATDVSSLGFWTFKETIVCIDDIERRGENLSIRDVLGLVMLLKEQRKCKVIMILNDEKLSDDTEDFRLYFEKIVDISLKFAPTPAECVQIALTTADAKDRVLAESCVTLGINNIRLIKKIERSIRNIEPMLAKYDELVLRQAVQSLVLLGWCVYEPGIAPPIDYVRSFNVYAVASDKNKTLSDSEVSWNSTLSSFGFTSMDEFDSVLLDGIRDGYFNSQKLEERAANLDKIIKDKKADSSFTQAWALYHDSFDNNQEEVLDSIVDSFKKNVHVVNALSMDGTVSLLKELGRGEQAAEILALYVESRGNSRESFELTNWPLGGNVTDPDVRDAFKRKLQTTEIQRNPRDVLLAIGKAQSWSQEDISLLAAVSMDEYYRMLKETKGDVLRKLIDAGLFFKRISNASAPTLEISKRVKEALRRIGQESPLNACRVRKYGVRVEQSDITPRA